MVPSNHLGIRRHFCLLTWCAICFVVWVREIKKEIDRDVWISNSIKKRCVGRIVLLYSRITVLVVEKGGKGWTNFWGSFMALKSIWCLGSRKKEKEREEMSHAVLLWRKTRLMIFGNYVDCSSTLLFLLFWDTIKWSLRTNTLQTSDFLSWNFKLIQSIIWITLVTCKISLSPLIFFCHSKYYMHE